MLMHVNEDETKGKIKITWDKKINDNIYRCILVITKGYGVRRQWLKVKTLLFQRCALRKFHVTDGQKAVWSNSRDQITSNRRSKRVWSSCVLCIPHILTGSPNGCWLHTCNACIITTWKLGLRAPLVAHKNFSSWNQEWNSSPICKASSE